MNPGRRRPFVAITFVALLFASGVGNGLLFEDMETLSSGVRVDSLEALSSQEQMAIEERWAGGGPAIHFADDMSLETQRHHEAEGLAYPIADYYGGAAADASASGPARWNHDLYRWGTGLEKDAEVAEWHRMEGHWRFGRATEEGPDYVGGALAELVTPVIDLRSVEPVVPLQSPQYHVEDTTVGPANCSGVMGTVWTLVSEDCQAVVSTGTAQEVQPEVFESAAALRFTHSYDFRTRADGTLTDGGRIEVSYYGSPGGTWSPWIGVTPTHAALKIGNETLEARGQLLGEGELVHRYGLQADHGGAGIDGPQGDVDPEDPGDLSEQGPPVTADPENATVTAHVHKDNTQNVSDSDGTPVHEEPPTEYTVDSEDPSQVRRTPTAPPHLYQGEIASSTVHYGSPRTGFGASSNGPVESVVDLSPFAGELVRIRFVASTGESLDLETGRVEGWNGWGIESLDIRSDSTKEASIIGLAEPGTSTVIHPTMDFHPVVVVQNHGTDPREVQTALRVRGHEEAVLESRLSVGPIGRSFIPFEDSFHDLFTPGTVPDGLEWMDVSLQEDAEDGPLDAAHSTSVLADLDERTFYVHAIEVEKWSVEDAGMVRLVETNEGEEVERPGNFYQVGQSGIVRAKLTNKGTLPAPIDLEGMDADLRPRLMDLAGTEIDATFTLIPSPDIQDGSVELPVTRDMAGTLGSQDDSVTVSWRWAGNQVPEILNLELVGTGSGLPRAVSEVNVQTARPPVLEGDFSNDWKWTPMGEGSGCERRTEHQDRIGVVACQGETSTVTSEVAAMGRLDLRRGRDTSIGISYAGAGEAVLQINASQDALQDLPPSTAVWEDLDSVDLSDTGGAWNTTEAPLQSLPEDWEGWIRLLIRSSPEGIAVDSARLALVLSNPDTGEEEFIPVIRKDFDRGVKPAPLDVRSTGSAGLAWLQSTAQSDAVLELAETVDLTDLSRPEFSFREWHGLGDSQIAFLEATTLAPSPVEHEDDGRLASVQHDAGASALEWVPLFSFDGRTVPVDTVSTTVSLDSFVGETLRLRFRVHQYNVASPEDIGTGLILDEFRLSGFEQNGRTSRDLVENWTLDSVASGGEIDFAASVQVIPGSNPWQREETAWRLDTDSKRYPGDSLVTDPLPIGSMQQPVLRIRHLGSFEASYRSFNCGSGYDKVASIDVEYQEMQADGSWPAVWQRVHEDADEPRLFAPGPGKTPAGRPFSTTTLPCPSDPPTGSITHAYPEQLHEFDLSPLAKAGTIRLQFTGFQKDLVPTANRAGEPDIDWAIQSIEVEEARHLVDASVDVMVADRDDRERLLERDPVRASALGIDEEIVLAKDQPFITVNVTNEGIVPLLLEVSLVGERIDGGDPLQIRLVRETPNGFVPDPVLSTGRLELDSLASGQVHFVADLDESEIGEYRLTARADSLRGADTDFRDNVLQRPLRILPFRDLRLELDESLVSPFAAGPGGERTVNVRLVNEGNVVEGAVNVSARVVRMTGLNAFEDLGFDLGNQSRHEVQNRGDGRPLITWSFGPGDVPADVELRPGQKYAVMVQVDPTPDSVTRWWDEGPLAIREDGTGLLDLTRPVNPKCDCLLMPFLVEQVLYSTDFSALNSTTKLKDLFDVSTDDAVVEGWTTRTLVEGREIDAAERYPSWQVADPEEALSTGSSGASGRIWHLPAYDGREEVVNVLESPVLPAHVVRGDSRAVLDLHHRSTVDEGQAFAEARQLVGGSWTDWEPLDAVRSERVAVVLAPDFPKVIPSAVSSPATMYQDGLGGHPVPPFYDDPPPNSTEGGPKITPGGQCDNGRSTFCRWGPYPAFPDQPDAMNKAWIDALNLTLRTLSEDLEKGRRTDHGIALFTTLETDDGLDVNDALGVGQSRGDRLVYPLSSTDGSIDYEFPIRSLDELGLNLDTYGAILLVGDNATTTFADRSKTLVEIGLGDRDAARMDPDPLALEHHEKLFEILRAAPSAGVGIIGSMGPAAGTLALSGVAAGADLAVWQTTAHMPHPNDGMWRLSGTASSPVLQCTYVWDGQGGHTHPGTPVPDQPLPPCVTPNPPPQPPTVRDFDAQYLYLSPYDAQSHALLDFLQLGGASNPFNKTFRVTFSQGPPLGSCATTHPLVQAAGTMFVWIDCAVHPGVVQDEKDGVTFVTMARPSDTMAWLDRLTKSLADVDGALPTGTGEWSDLEPRFSFPVGGTYQRLSNGDDYFDGTPTQIRIEVHSDPESGGHGAFTVDRLSLLGTNRTQGLGLRWIEPTHGSSYAPGRPFDVVLEVTNRGVTSTTFKQVAVEAEQWFQGGDECRLPIPEGETVVDIDPLLGGQQLRVPLDPPFNAGRFPIDQFCDIPLQSQENVVNFSASLSYADENRLDPDLVSDDDDPFDDAIQATVLGQQIVDQFAISSLHVSPNEIPREETDTIQIEALVSNGNTQDQTVSVTLRIDHARPLPCLDGTFTRACDENDQFLKPYIANRQISLKVPRDATVPFTFDVDLEKSGMDAGVYLASAFASTTVDAGQGLQTLTTPLVQARIHLSGDEVEPDDGWAFDGNDLAGLQPLQAAPLSSPPSTYQPDFWHPNGFYATGTGASENQQQHDGLYGPDPRTRDDSDQNLAHGWRVTSCKAACPVGANDRVVEWKRDAAAAYDPETDGTVFLVPRGTPVPRAAQAGVDDFGPDRLIWYPYDGEDRRHDPENRNQYLTLASFDDPVLTVLGKWEATDLTGFVVEMQVPVRQPCAQTATSSVTSCVDEAWDWNTRWLPLQSNERPEDTPHTNVTASDSTMTYNCAGGTIQTAACRDRFQDSNPVGAIRGQWGTRSGQIEGDGGWERLTYDIFDQPGIDEFCQQLIQSGSGGGNEVSTPGRDPCRYAHVDQTNDGGDIERYIGRPVRFRFSAGSYGGDAGTNYWQIADVALTEHRARFVGPDRLEVEMLDDSTRILPLRVENLGSVNDVFSVKWVPPHGVGFLEGVDVKVDLSTDFSTPKDEVSFELGPGESRPVWVRIDTGILDRRPGAEQKTPFIMEVSSTRDPFIGDQLLVDASFKSRSWADLEVDTLVLDDDDAHSGIFRASEGVDVTPVVIVSNTGRMAVGSESTPVHVALHAEQRDCQTGAFLARHTVATGLIQEPIRPLNAPGGEPEAIRLDPWTPPMIGCFELVAEVNRPDLVQDGLLSLPESDSTNNQEMRKVVVGPVKFPDLQVTEMWLSPLEDGCDTTRQVQRAVAGQLYCIVAKVENKGLEDAVGPRAEFSTGASPFSIEDFREAYPSGAFPGGGEETSLATAPWPARMRSDGGNTWTFFVNVFSDSFSTNLANKERSLTVEVDEYSAVIDGFPTSVTVAPSQEATLTFNLSNKGNAPMTPLVAVHGVPDAAKAQVSAPTQMLPGERLPVNLRIVIAPDSPALSRDLTVSLASAEDPGLRIERTLELHVPPTERSELAILPARSVPGKASLEVLLDNGRNEGETVWSVASIAGPVQTMNWSHTTPAYNRSLQEIPVVIKNTTPPGVHDVELTLHGISQEKVFLARGTGSLVVLPVMDLDVTPVVRQESRPSGGSSVVDVHLTNTGNIPLDYTVENRLPLGVVTPQNVTGALDAGQSRIIGLMAQAPGSERAVGDSVVEWSSGSSYLEGVGDTTVSWHISHPVDRLRIGQSSLSGLEPVASSRNTVMATVENAGAGPTTAEALLVVDGTVHGAVEVTLEANETRRISLPFVAGQEGEPQNVALIVRPAGSHLSLQESGFYETGDALVVQVAASAEPDRVIPGVSLPFLGLVLLFIAAVQSRRREGQ